LPGVVAGRQGAAELESEQDIAVRSVYNHGVGRLQERGTPLAQLKLEVVAPSLVAGKQLRGEDYLGSAAKLVERRVERATDPPQL
jgi:hypothetical protein